VTGLEKLTQLKELHLSDNPDLTKAQIAELQKALPKSTTTPRSNMKPILFFDLNTAKTQPSFSSVA